MKRIISSILLFSFVINLCACGVDATVNDVVDQVTNISQADEEHVLGVKNGTNPSYPGATYEEAFESFFAYPTWKYFKGTQEGPDDDNDGKPDYTNDDIDVVEFTGSCTYLDVEVTARIQFTLDMENGTFEATYLAFNDVPQNSLILGALIQKAFESYLGTSEVSTEEPEDIYIEETPAEASCEISDISEISGLYTHPDGVEMSISIFSSDIYDNCIGNCVLTYEDQSLYFDVYMIDSPSKCYISYEGELNAYLYFSSTGDTVICELYDTDGSYSDTMTMAYHYES